MADNPNRAISRRSFLQITGQALAGLGGLLGLGGVVRFLSYQPDPPAPKRFEIGALADFPPETSRVIAAIPALVINKGGNLHAISLSCSHLGCQVEARPNQLACPCHGSRFDLDGQVTHGPAAAALDALRVEINADGMVVVIKAG